MIKKILIANRGEIACRVMKTAKAMGIKTVAVYSEADADAKHVDMADEAVLIGPAPAAQSYLLHKKILSAAKKTGADAIHPGYGFLSENGDFVKAVKAEGIKFIGPNVTAIRAMGDKIESKKLAAKAGVNTVPGYMGIIKDEKEAVKIADDIGYPVMIKASAGGGGKGMRIAHSKGEVEEGFQSAKSEAKSSFADDRVFIEKFIEEPRHIEIQVLADGHGNCIYLGERECSIQRRHQKVIEEAPSPFLDAKTRKAMGEQAVSLAKAVKYQSAGTVEFIVDKNKNFYFLEMNTRLQVEHPVTELVTGIDLVEWMIRVADGEKLALKQSDIKLNGWAMESRVYAEDPYKGFLPSIGRLTRYRPPAESKTVRVDDGIYEGSEISMFYDPMIAKLCTWGKTRDAAIEEMQSALDHYYIRGITHNIPFLADVMRNKRFIRGNLTTNFIAEEYKNGFEGGKLTAHLRRNFAAAAAFMHAVEAARAGQISGQIRDVATPERRDWIVFAGEGDPLTVQVLGTEKGADILIDGKKHVLESDWVPGDALVTGVFAGKDFSIEIARGALGLSLYTAGVKADVSVLSKREAELMQHMPVKEAPDTSRLLLCPMPGLVVSINVSEGDEISAGQNLCVVEAMKMENILRAEKDGVVSAIKAKAGDSLAVDDIIMEFE